MTLPSDPVTWLKLVGTVFSAAGSLLLAWRVKQILKWVVYALVAHEQSLTQLRKFVNHEPQTGPVVEGVTVHLLDVESRLGFVLLILGFVCFGIGMLCNAATYLLGAS